jgi:osmotically-inducible protein OsmY
MMNEPTSNQPSDHRGRDLADRVAARVQHLMSGRVRDFRVQIEDRGLVLQGRTRTYHAKQLVRQAAMEVAGKPILADEVEVF